MTVTSWVHLNQDLKQDLPTQTENTVNVYHHDLKSCYTHANSYVDIKSYMGLQKRQHFC